MEDGNTLMNNYGEAYEALLEHVGLEEDWVVCPINDSRRYIWHVGDGVLNYGATKEDISSGDGYASDIYTQRFYPKHVYEGKDLTLVFADPHVDGMKWWMIFDNTMRITDEEWDKMEKFIW